MNIFRKGKKSAEAALLEENEQLKAEMALSETQVGRHHGCAPRPNGRGLTQGRRCEGASVICAAHRIWSNSQASRRRFAS